MKTLSLGAALVAAAAIVPSAALAQSAASDTLRSEIRGPFVGLNVIGASAGRENGPDRASGGGVGVTAGYGVSDAVSLYVRGDLAYRASYVDAGVRYSFGAGTSRLRPYVEGGVARIAMDAFEQDATGYGVTVGAGAEYFLARWLSVDAGLTHTRGQITDGPGEGRSFDATRLSVGFKLRP